MLDKVKLALRLSGTALDGEVSDLINAAIADLRLVGINIPAEAGSSSKTLGDPLCPPSRIDGQKETRYNGKEGRQRR